MFLTLAPVPANASEATAELIKHELADAANISAEDFGDISYSKVQNGIEVKYSFSIGEGGIEESLAKYRADGTLESITTEYEYVSHSMGPGNSRRIINAVRYYNWGGDLVKAAGKIRTTKLLNNKITESRKITKVNDHALEELSTPLLKLNKDILRSVKLEPAGFLNPSN